MNKKILFFYTLSFLLSTSYIDSLQAATISGSIAFKGQCPAVQAIKMDADPNCKMTHKDGVFYVEVIIKPNSTPKFVFVYV